MYSSAKIYVTGYCILTGGIHAYYYRDCNWAHSLGIALARGIAFLGSNRVRQVFNLDSFFARYTGHIPPCRSKAEIVMKLVLVTGATSQVGRLFLPRLAEAGYKVMAISHRDVPATALPPVTWVQLDLHQSLALSLPIAKPDALVHLAPIQLLPDFLESGLLSGLKRILTFSTTSAVTKVHSANPREQAFVESILQAEDRLKCYSQEQKIAYTVFRPTMIYGLGMDKNVSLIARFIDRFGFFPLIGRAEGLRQPVHADDLAAACISALEQPLTYGRIYQLGGAEVLPYRVMIERIFEALERRPRFMRLPMSVLRTVIYGLSHIQRFAYLTPEMADRINQDMVFDIAQAIHDFDYKPRIFKPSKIELIGNY